MRRSTPLVLLPFLSPTLAQISSISSLTSQWNLNAAQFSFAVPATALGSNDASEYILDNWSAARIDWGEDDITFSPDPSTSSSTLVRRQEATTSSHSSRTRSRSSTAGGSSSTTASTPASTASLNGQPPVLRVEYPQGSYSKSTGGTQFFARPLNSTSGQSSGNGTSNGAYERMMLTYDVWFPNGYAWSLGGKLPGLRGGPDSRGCSGGNQTDGTTCFSTRLMWRPNGAGEVYAYIPTTQSGFCSESGITCNSDYGTSLARGSFTFATGQWQSIYLLVVLNSEGSSNGVVQLWYNGALALSFTDLTLRRSSDIASIGGVFFSTFFGGDDTTWATPTTQYTYYRNMALYAGYGASNGTGAKISAAHRTTFEGGMDVGMWTWAVGAVVGLVGMIL